MSESTKKKRLRGFAGVIANQLEPVNNKQRFKEKFKEYKDFKILINPKDGRYAAIININDAILTVDGIRNNDKIVLKNLKNECDGFLEMDTNLFMKVAKGELSFAAMAKKVATRKIKIKGMKNVRVLDKLFYYLTDEVK